MNRYTIEDVRHHSPCWEDEDGGLARLEHVFERFAAPDGTFTTADLFAVPEAVVPIRDQIWVAAKLATTPEIVVQAAEWVWQKCLPTLLQVIPDPDTVRALREGPSYYAFADPFYYAPGLRSIQQADAIRRARRSLPSYRDAAPIDGSGNYVYALLADFDTEARDFLKAVLL